MKRLVVATLATVTLATSSQASLMDLPDDVMIYMSGYLEPKDAVKLCSVNKKLHATEKQLEVEDKIITVPGLRARIEQAQLPKIYKNIGLNYKDVLIKFDHPRWNLQERMPKVIKSLIHDWYFAGMNVKNPFKITTAEQDPFKRFCHLMAAGRAGHHFAAQEAGKMLMAGGVAQPDLDQETNNVGGPVIPLVVTIEDLIRAVPDLSIPHVRRWDVSNLKEDLIDDADVRQAYEDYEDLYAREQSDQGRIVMSSKSPAEAIVNVNNYVTNINKFMDNYSRGFETFPAQDSDEYKVMKNLLSAQRQFNEYTYFNDLAQCLREVIPVLMPYETDGASDEISDRSNSHITNIKLFGVGLLAYLEERLKKIEKPSIKEFQVKNAMLTRIPLYWDFLSYYYKGNKSNSQQLNALKALLGLRLVPSACGGVADCLYNTLSLSNLPNSKKALEVVAQARTLHILACLMDRTGYCGDLVTDFDDQYKVHHHLLYRDGDEGQDLGEVANQKVYNFYQELHPMIAFTLQLNLLRNPLNTDVYDAIQNFYKGRMKMDGDALSHSINEDRSKAALDIKNQIEVEEDMND